MLLEEARQAFFQSAIIEEEITLCPCCQRRTKAYDRPFNTSMLKSLEWLYRESNGGLTWVDVPSFAPRWLVRTNQLASCRWWGLVERDDRLAEQQDKKHTGYWRTTKLAHDWLLGNAKIPRSAFTYAGNVLAMRGPDITPEEVDEAFSYSETIRGHHAQEA